MEEQNNFIEQQGETTPDKISQMDAISGVFTSPGNTYDIIGKMKEHHFWIIPFIILIILGMLSTYLLNNDNELTAESRTLQKQYLQKMIDNIEKKEKDNIISADQAVKIKEDLQKNIDEATGKSGYIGIHIGNIIYIFFLSLVALILLKIMKGKFTYLNIINVIVLSMLIMAVGDLLNVLISIFLGTNTNLGLNIFLKPPIVPLYIFVFFGALDLFDVWFIITISIGFSKIAKVKFVPVIITFAVIRILIACILAIAVILPDIIFG